MRSLHLSVDFWHTLGTPNGSYRPLRNAILAAHYGCTPQQAAAAYAAAKDSWEADAVETGAVPPLEAVDRTLRMRLGLAMQAQVSFATGALPRLQQAFLQHPPHVCPEALANLRAMRATGATLSIGSNTNFIIRGAVVRQLLPDDLFSFQIYSDEIGYAKPHPAFFTAVALRAGQVNPALRGPRDIVQVGDSPHCDVDGASACGMLAMLVTETATAAQAVGSHLPQVA